MTGGYYDAGDNVKFTFPMAFTATVLAWSVLEFGDSMGPDQHHALNAIRWATDFLMKATNKPDTVYFQVGHGQEDHNCWQRPEDMDTPRTVFAATIEKPSSDVSAEIAAALAATSIVFKYSDQAYSATLLSRAKKVGKINFIPKYLGGVRVLKSLNEGYIEVYQNILGVGENLLSIIIYIIWKNYNFIRNIVFIR